MYDGFLIPLRQQGTPAGVMGPKSLSADHFMVGLPCPACLEPLAEGEPIALVPIGPGEDEDDRAKARAGGWHSGSSVATHWACATGEAVAVEPEEGE